MESNIGLVWGPNTSICNEPKLQESPGRFRRIGMERIPVGSCPLRPNSNGSGSYGPWGAVLVTGIAAEFVVGDRLHSLQRSQCGPEERKSGSNRWDELVHPI